MERDSPDNSGDFVYDYELIRRGGLIFAAVLFCLGIAIIFSDRLTCGRKRNAKYPIILHVLPNPVLNKRQSCTSGKWKV
ncbi:hypothetical protein QTP86_023023 [Hemibagrus guttatus]|nr:hypothetical protein QTP86_023023 [Hemibagrus guttatus]